MVKLAWASDIHLDCVPDNKWYDYMEEELEDCNGLLITGDISNAKSLLTHLTKLSTLNTNIYFVLGNHDYWGASFPEVQNQLKSLPNNLYYLNNHDPIIINDTAIVGADGWYDCRYGDFANPKFIMGDWSRMKEYAGSVTEIYGKLTINSNLINNVSRQKSKEDTNQLVNKIHNLDKTNINHIIVLTHFPPYDESSYYQGQMSDRYAIPYFTNKYMGENLDMLAEQYKVNFTTLCGHTHEARTYHRMNNLVVHTAFANYGFPCIYTALEF